MNCSNCGKEIKPGYSLCPYCETSIETSVQPSGLRISGNLTGKTAEKKLRTAVLLLQKSRKPPAAPTSPRPEDLVRQHSQMGKAPKQKIPAPALTG